LKIIHCIRSEKRMKIVGAIDVGGTKIAVGLVDSAGTILEREVQPTDREKDFEFGLAQMQAMLRACLDRRPGVRLSGIGVGCTGPVNPLTGMLGPNSFLTPWEGINTFNRMQEVFDLPVAIENDADAAALGEFAWGAGRGASRCLYVTVSTGIGCGLVLDGRLYRGASDTHPELGHLVIDPERGPACYCGARGCWESLAAGPAMAAWYAFRRQELGLPPDDLADAKEVCRRATQQDTAAQEAALREGYYLGIGLANLVTAFIPDVIILGGGVMESWPLFERRVQTIIRQTCGLVPYELAKLRQASLGANTGLAGAAQVWFHRYGQLANQ
jgi:glucokinase